jgi:hypothetical protein
MDQVIVEIDGWHLPVEHFNTSYGSYVLEDGHIILCVVR